MAEKKKKDEQPEEAAIETPQTETVETAADEQPVAEKQKKPAKKKTAAKKPADAAKKPESPDGGEPVERKHKRAEKIGVVFSDKMMKTVVVRVDRTVQHSMYRKYMKKRKKFMAHDELGAVEGDKVRIVETRPLSARKRWRVAEIIQKAKK